MSSPISNQRAPTHHHLPHRTSAHATSNTHVTVTPPPATPTHHRTNSSGGTSMNTVISTLTSPENDTNSGLGSVTLTNRCIIFTIISFTKTYQSGK